MQYQYTKITVAMSVCACIRAGGDRKRFDPELKNFAVFTILAPVPTIQCLEYRQLYYITIDRSPHLIICCHGQNKNEIECSALVERFYGIA